VEERNANGNCGVMRGIEIEDRSFHAERATQADLKVGAAKMLDETRKIGGAV